MNNKPNIIIVDDLARPFVEAIDELESVISGIDAFDEQRSLKSYFLYSYAVFESAITSSYKEILFAFPERIESDLLDFKKYKKYIIENSLVRNLIESISDGFSKKITYSKIGDVLNKYGKTIQIKVDKIDIGQIQCIKDVRNDITHNNTISMVIDKDLLIKWVQMLKNTLEIIKERIEIKYREYTKLALIKKSWNYIFSSPLLCFENHWVVKDGSVQHYNGDTLENNHSSLSGSERTLLILFMANYGTVCANYYSINDIGLHISLDDRNKDRIAYITELFYKYPRLLL